MARESPSITLLTQMCECLGRLALFAGGTRDICALIEHLVYYKLNEAGVLKNQKNEGGKRALCHAAITIVFNKCSGQSSTGEYLFLEELLGVAATLLDEDLRLVAQTESGLHTDPTQENTVKNQRENFNQQ